MLIKQQSMNIFAFFLFFLAYLTCLYSIKTGHISIMSKAFDSWTLFSVLMIYTNYTSIQAALESEEEKDKRKKMINKILGGPSKIDKLMGVMMWVLCIVVILDLIGIFK